MNRQRIVIGMLMLAALSGCATTQKVVHDPAYAPARPEPEQRTQPSNGSIYQVRNDPVSAKPLFEDRRAKRVGDLLTIMLVEETSAEKSAETDITKSNANSISNPTLLGRSVQINPLNGLPLEQGDWNLGFGLESDHEFAGSGESTQSNKLEGEITVTVAEVMSNGNLVVRGEKILSLNQGDEFIRISGIVRPDDITSDNTVLSTKVANPRIAYGGTGAVNDSNAMGWLARFFVSAIWPF